MKFSTSSGTVLAAVSFCGTLLSCYAFLFDDIIAQVFLPVFALALPFAWANHVDVTAVSLETRAKTGVVRGACRQVLWAMLGLFFPILSELFARAMLHPHLVTSATIQGVQLTRNTFTPLDDLESQDDHESHTNTTDNNNNDSNNGTFSDPESGFGGGDMAFDGSSVVPARCSVAHSLAQGASLLALGLTLVLLSPVLMIPSSNEAVNLAIGCVVTLLSLLSLARGTRLSHAHSAGALLRSVAVLLGCLLPVASVAPAAMLFMRNRALLRSYAAATGLALAIGTVAFAAVASLNYRMYLESAWIPALVVVPMVSFSVQAGIGTYLAH